MIDPNFIENLLIQVEEASYRGTIRAHEKISSVIINEKEWLTTEEAVRDYKVSPQTLWRKTLDVKNLENITFRLNTDWKKKGGINLYHRNALEREFVRRAKNNVRDIKLAA